MYMCSSFGVVLNNPSCIPLKEKGGGRETRDDMGISRAAR